MIIIDHHHHHHHHHQQQQQQYHGRLTAADLSQSVSQLYNVESITSLHFITSRPSNLLTYLLTYYVVVTSALVTVYRRR